MIYLWQRILFSMLQTINLPVYVVSIMIINKVMCYNGSRTEVLLIR